MWDIQRSHENKVEAKCPQCGQLMANMGLDFASPKKTDNKQWQHLKTLYSVGITFHSCGCSGPGYIPNSKERLIAHFEELIVCYHQQLAFWRHRPEPTNEREMQRDKSKNWDHITQVYHAVAPQKGFIANEDAKNYWIARIKEVEQKLQVIK